MPNIFANEKPKNEKLKSEKPKAESEIVSKQKNKQITEDMKFFLSILLVLGLAACENNRSLPGSLTESGVSRELASFRKEQLKDVRYQLFFSLPASKQEPVKGVVGVSLRLTGKVPVILDFRGTAEQITALQLNGEEVLYRVENEHIILSAEDVVEGENQVNIAFTPSDQSLNRREEFLYTLLVPDRARTLFPCFDQPDMKSIFTLALEIPADWQAVANGAILTTDTTSVTGRKLIRFRGTEPLSTYLFSFVAGKLVRETYTRGEREISLYHRETDPEKIAQCPEIAGEVFDALEWLEDYTAIPYPFAKYDLIILPGFQYGGMEHTGATLYNDGRMFLDEHPTLNDKLGRSALIAHETSHMWFGDYVTMEWFDDVWTKEVFANYFASQIVEPLFPQVNHRLNFIRDYLPPAYSEDRTRGANPIKQILPNLNQAGLAYGNIIYDKSPVMMEMLIRRMGKDTFQKGIRDYLKKYAYGNATWDGLISILDLYTEEDLTRWSQVWVNEKGMPEITAEISDGRLIVSQSDPFGRGLYWPQALSYQVICGKDSQQISIELRGDAKTASQKLDFHPNPTDPEEIPIILPNTDGRGYGFFCLNEQEAIRLFPYLLTSPDEVLKGSLLITLYENLLHKNISPEWYREAMLEYTSRETNSLLFSMALGYIGNCQRWYPQDAIPLEAALWRMVEQNPVASHRLQAFRLYRSIATSPEAIRRMYTLWKNKQEPAGCPLSENDYIQLSYVLALRMPVHADEILAIQQSRITNPDRRKEYAFISPSLSPRKTERDSVFTALLLPENRRIEPWASAALAYLNHPLRQKEAIAYIRPALEIMPEVQKTGDIFFPTAWVRALLSGHTSVEAKAEVDRFFATYPDFPEMLSNKVKQQADHLYR